MSDKELNSYRLTSMDEPTDEMLLLIMKEAASEAVEKWENANRRFFDELRSMAQNNTIQTSI